MKNKEMRQIYVSAELHAELQIAKQILGQSVPQIITEGVRHRLKPVQKLLKRAGQKVERSKPKVFDEDSIELVLAGFLYENLKERDPGFKKPNLQGWARHIEALIKKDGRGPKEVQDVLEWIQTEPFWQSRILSTESFRYKYQTLFAQMKAEPKILNKNKGIEEGFTKAGGIAPTQEKLDKYAKWEKTGYYPGKGEE